MLKGNGSRRMTRDREQITLPRPANCKPNLQNLVM